MALTIADRTTKSTTYRDPQLGDRWRQLVARLDDVWLKDQTSGWQWEAVDELPVVDGLNGYAWRVDKMRHRIRMAEDGGRAWYPRRDLLEFVTFGRPEVRVGVNWTPLPNKPPDRVGNVWTWDFWATQGARLRVVVTWRHVKFEVEYKDAASARRVRWPVSLTGLVWDGWALRSVSDGQIVGSVQAPWAEDANGTRFTVTPSTYLETSQRYVEFTADLTGVVYPVRIDPTLTTPQDNTVADTQLVSSVADNNFGASPTGGIYNNYSGNYRAYLTKFDYSSIPGGSTVDSSSLHLFSSGVVGEVNYTLYAAQILAANSGWIEGTKDNAAADAGEPTYNNRAHPSTAWAGSVGCGTSGTDYSSTDDGSAAVTTPAVSNGYEYVLSLTPSRVEAIIAANYGYRMRITADKGEIVHSSDSATAAYRPYQVVEYTAAGGANLLALLGVG